MKPNDLGKVIITFPSGDKLNAAAPGGLSGVLAAYGWDAGVRAADRAERRMTSAERMVAAANARSAMRRAII